MKKYLLLFFFFSLFYFVAFTQGIWTQKANFPGNPRSGAIGFSINGKGYIGLGVDATTAYNDLWEYDTTLDSWTQKADFPILGRGGAVGFSIGNKGYMGTGADSAYRNDFWEYDPAADAWSQKASLPSDTRQGAVGFSIGNKGYIGTGESGAFANPLLEDFWEYDPVLDSWTQKANYGGGLRVYASCFSIGGKGYIGLGYNGSFETNDLWEYDTSSAMWNIKANIPGVLRQTSVGFSIGSIGYFGTGASSISGCLDKFLGYDTLTNLWTQKSNFGGAARGVAVGFSIGPKGYIGTGACSVRYNDFWEYNPDSTVGIMDMQIGQNDFKIFPSPNSGKFLVINDVVNEKKHIKIFDIYGNKIYDNYFLHARILQIDLSDKENGIYFVLIAYNNKELTKKIIINH